MATQITEGLAYSARLTVPARGLSIVSDGVRWTATCAALVRELLASNVADAPLPVTLYTLSSGTEIRLTRFVGTVDRVNHDALRFDDGVVVALDKVVAVHV